MTQVKIEYLNKSKAEQLMIENSIRELQNLGINNEYVQAHAGNIRTFYGEIIEKYFMYFLQNGGEFRRGDKYKFDLHFGLQLYNYVNENIGASMRDVADPEFWAYLSVMVIPDIVSSRHGEKNHTRFYRQNNRVYLSTLWWYVHLSWQGDTDSTYDVLKDNSTDEIMNLVERSSSKGYRIELYREIMLKYSMIEDSSKRRGSEKSVFRKIMTMNTTFIGTTEPSLLPGKEVEYVERIFEYLGLKDHNGKYVLEV